MSVVRAPFDQRSVEGLHESADARWLRRHVAQEVLDLTCLRGLVRESTSREALLADCGVVHAVDSGSLLFVGAVRRLGALGSSSRQFAGEVEVLAQFAALCMSGQLFHDHWVVEVRGREEGLGVGRAVAGGFFLGVALGSESAIARGVARRGFLFNTHLSIYLLVELGIDIDCTGRRVLIGRIRSKERRLVL